MNSNQTFMKINGDTSTVLSIDLLSVLSLIPDGGKYRWSILWLKGTGKPYGKSILELEERIHNSAIGLVLDWRKLFDLAGMLNQIIDLTLIGTLDATSLKRFGNESEMYQKCDFVIELIDSSYWIIHCKDENDLDLFASLKGAEKLSE